MIVNDRTLLRSINLVAAFLAVLCLGVAFGPWAAAGFLFFGLWVRQDPE